MVRWIAFDDESAEAVVCRYRRGAAEIQQGDAVASALKLGRPSRVLLPGVMSGRVVVAHFQPKSDALLGVALLQPRASQPDKMVWRRPRSA
jgi:hypothetical protein